jgi:hypothetical protein
MSRTFLKIIQYTYIYIYVYIIFKLFSSHTKRNEGKGVKQNLAVGTNGSCL